MENSTWFFDMGSSEGAIYKVTDHLVREKTDYQLIEIFKTEAFGNCLILDGDPQASDFDYKYYHEALIYPAMLLSNAVKRIFLAGGGDGAALREILRFSNVEHVIMAEIDKRVVELSNQYLGWADKSYSDTRVELYFEDASNVLSRSSDKFDCIIIDATSPQSSQLSGSLFSREFYKLVKEKLTPDGIIATQAQSTHPSDTEVFGEIFRNLSNVFTFVRPYHLFIPFYYMTWGFAIASPTMKLDPEIASGKLIKQVNWKTEYMNAGTMLSVFQLPEYLVRTIK